MRDDYLLPCDVRLPQATTIRAGSRLSTLIVAMEAGYRDRHFRGRSTDNHSLLDLQASIFQSVMAPIGASPAGSTIADSDGDDGA